MFHGSMIVSGFPTEITYAFITSPVYAAFQIFRALVDLITVQICNSALCNFLYFLLIFSVLGPDTVSARSPAIWIERNKTAYPRHSVGVSRDKEYECYRRFGKTPWCLSRSRRRLTCIHEPGSRVPVYLEDLMRSEHLEISKSDLIVLQNDSS
jgi:hypothetical protein